MTYYVNESSSAKAGQGAFAIHPDLKSLFCELLPENLPFNRVPPPSEIVDHLKMSEPATHEKSVNILAVGESEELYSPSFNYNRNIESETFNFNNSTFGFGLNSTEFELAAFNPSWLSNGDILPLSEDERTGHVPSPAPGDAGSNNLHSPQRKLSVIPEVPGFSRPPSLAELTASKQKSSNNSLEIIVSGAKETKSATFFHPSAIPRSLAGYDRLQQHSIESSVVTEGHYDASFEDGDGLASFDIDTQNYIYLDEPTILSNGHFQMSQQEMKMLGMKSTTNGHDKLKTSSDTNIPDQMNILKQTTTTATSSASTSQPISQPNGNDGGNRKG